MGPTHPALRSQHSTPTDSPAELKPRALSRSHCRVARSQVPRYHLIYEVGVRRVGLNNRRECPRHLRGTPALIRPRCRGLLVRLAWLAWVGRCGQQYYRYLSGQPTRPVGQGPPCANGTQVYPPYYGVRRVGLNTGRRVSPPPSWHPGMGASMIRDVSLIPFGWGLRFSAFPWPRITGTDAVYGHPPFPG